MCVMFLHRAVVQYKTTRASSFITFISGTNRNLTFVASDLIRVKAGIQLLPRFFNSVCRFELTDFMGNHVV